MPRACHGLLSSFPAFSASEFRSDPFQTVERDLRRPFRKILSFSRSFFSLHNSSFEILFRVDLFHISSGLARKRRLRQGNLVKIPGEKKMVPVRSSIPLYRLEGKPRMNEICIFEIPFQNLG